MTGGLQLNSGACTSTLNSVCQTAGAQTVQDLLLYCANAATTLDIGVTLTSSVSEATALQLLSIPSGGIETFFPSVTGTSSGSLC